jgi:hypothetical protein
LITEKELAIRAPFSLPMMLTMLQIVDTAITLVFYTIIAVAAVLVLGSRASFCFDRRLGG